MVLRRIAATQCLSRESFYLRSLIRQPLRPPDDLNGVDQQVATVLDMMQEVPMQARPASRRSALRSIFQIARLRPRRWPVAEAITRPAGETTRPLPPARAAPKLSKGALRSVFKLAIPFHAPTEELVPSAPVEKPHPEVSVEPAQPKQEDPESAVVETEPIEEPGPADEMHEQQLDPPPPAPAPRRTGPSPIDNLAREAEAVVSNSCKLVRLNVMRRHIELLQPITFYGSKHADGVDVYIFPRTAEAICKEVAFALGVCNDMLIAQKMDTLGLAVEGHTSASIHGHEESVMISTGAHSITRRVHARACTHAHTHANRRMLCSTPAPRSACKALRKDHQGHGAQALSR